jgi:hypothetical protein
VKEIPWTKSTGLWNEGGDARPWSMVDQVRVPFRGSNLSRWLKSNDQDKKGGGASGVRHLVVASSLKDGGLSATAHRRAP